MPLTAELYSPAGFEIRNFSGNHFFIKEQKKNVIEYISGVLNRYERSIQS